MIWSVDVKFEAPDEDAADAARNQIEAALDQNPFLGYVAVSDIAVVAPLVQFDDEEEQT